CPACRVHFRADPPDPEVPPAPPSPLVRVPERPAVVAPSPEEPEEIVRKPVLAPRRRRTAPPSSPDFSGPDFPRKSRSGAALLVGGTAVVLVLLGVLVFLSERKNPRLPVPVHPVENEHERRQAILEAFRNQEPLEADAITREIKPLFDEFGRAMRARDREGMVACFDLERLLDDPSLQEVVRGEWARDRARFLRGMREGMGQSL